MEISQKYSFLYIAQLILISSSFKIESRVLIDVINTYEKANRLHLQLCWKEHEIHFFISEISQERIRFVNTISESIKDKTLQQTDVENILFIIDLSCPGSDQLLVQASKNHQFRLPSRWILFDQNSFGQDYGNKLPADVPAINVSVDSEVALIHRVSDSDFDVNMIYKINCNDTWSKEFYGSWNSTHKFTKSNEMNQVIALRRRNLRGREIKVSIVITKNESIYHLTDGLQSNDDTLTKVNVRTTDHVLDFVNASRKNVITDSWGYQYNNTWTGMANSLGIKEADIGGTPMFMNRERLMLVDYISQPTPARIRFIFRQPKLSFENNIYLLSFQSSLWYGSTALLSILFIVLCISTIWEWKADAKNEACDANVGVLRPNVTDVALLIFGATCQQGSTVELKGTPGRIVLLFIFMYLTFLYTSFSANIVALLQSSSSQIRTLEDLLNSRMRLGAADMVYNRYYFPTETEPIRRAIYRTKIAPPGTKPNFLSVEDGVKEIRKGLFAFNVETGVGYKFIGKYFEESEKCDLMEIAYVQDTYPWIPVQKHFTFIEIFKIGTKRVQEHGLQQRENLLLYEKRPKCSEGHVNFVSVGMMDFYPALLVLLYGALFAGLLLITEILYHKNCKTRLTINRVF